MVFRRARTLVWRGRVRSRVAFLMLRNVFSRRPVSAGPGPVVSLTSHGDRLSHCHVTIESIGRGSLTPRRLMLWLDDERAFRDLPGSLRRLTKRGLEVRLVENFGPHTKYYPYVESEDDFYDPLVTADDDIIYPRWWLKTLNREARTTPGAVVGFRCRRVRMGVGGVLPYASWPFADGTSLSILNFATGVGGVIYPPEMLLALKHRGRAFVPISLAADDVWLHNTALRSGVSVRQVWSRAHTFPVIESTQASGLKHANVGEGRNDLIIASTYSDPDIEMLRAAAAAVGEAGVD